MVEKHCERSAPIFVFGGIPILPGGLLMRDVAGDLYRFPEHGRMDRHSRELLWAFVD